MAREVDEWPRTPAERFGHRLRNVASCFTANTAWLLMKVADPKHRECLEDMERACTELRDLCDRVEAAVLALEHHLTLPPDKA